MNQSRHHSFVRRIAHRCGVGLTAAGIVLALSACNEGPGDPPTPRPPKPVTEAGHVITSHFDLPARPAPPPRGLM